MFPRMKLSRPRLGIKAERMDDVSVFSSKKREQIRGELVATAKAD
jgi:hypothetical protein